MPHDTCLRRYAAVISRIKQAALLAVLSVTLSCAPEKPAPPHGIIFILIDTLRADGLGCYGAGAEASPAIDALARRGTRFQSAISPSSRTLPSVMSIMTALPPRVHGRIFTEEQSMEGLSPDISTMAEELRRRGYRTVAFTEGGYTASYYGFARGFDFYGEAEGISDKRSDVAATYERAALWLKKNAQRNKFFLFFHTYQTHLPYAPPSDYMTARSAAIYPKGFSFAHKEALETHPAGLRPEALKAIRALYQGEIQYVDAHIGKLKKLLEDLDIWEKTLVIFTSDHGDEFFERQHFGHSRTLYEELIRVPLIFHFPDRIPGNKVIDRQVSLLDILPTVMDLCGAEGGGKKNFYGRSLVPLFAGSEGNDDAPSVFSEVYRYDRLASIRQNQYKYILNRVTGRGELYDLENDPQEKQDLADRQRDLCADMRRDLLKFLNETEGKRKALRRTGPMRSPDPGLRERLQMLGYLEQEPP